MVVAELLTTLGMGTGAVLLIVGGLTVWHLRSGMKVMGRVRTWVMAFAVFSLLIFAGEAGLVPGLDPQMGRLFDWMLGLLETIVNLPFKFAGGVL